jgi:hypothetical protein
MEGAQLIIGIAVGSCTILGLGAGLVRHLVKYYLSELRPDGNGGHNLRGRIDHMDTRSALSTDTARVLYVAALLLKLSKKKS